ncbi:MAG: urate hydroxylase PuuD [Bacteroidota bacterium]
MKKSFTLLKLTLLFLFISLTTDTFAADKFKTNFSLTNWIFVVILLFIIIITYGILKSVVVALKQKNDQNFNESIKTKLEDVYEAKTVFLYIALIFVFLYSVYYFVQGTTWESHVTEWLNLVVRWAHVVFGIAWIGASFYFNFLENSLNRTKDLRDELAGNLWAVHGGGFYYLEKYKVAPKEIPKDLHWFKYEAYFTWLSGFTLLVIVYYLDAKVYLIDKEVLDIPSNLAVGIGMASLLTGWIVYDLLCKSALAKKPMLFWFILFLFLAGFAYFFLNVFSARAAYIHVGALIGTMMVGNVFKVIIPSQKAMVKAAKEGKIVNPLFGKNALLRSRHNNYLTLPVIFIMISNHFPSTYGNSFNWIVLIALSICSAMVKHYLNKIEKGEKAVWILPVAILGMISLTFVTAPREKEVCKEDVPATFKEVKTIIEKRCTQCHSINPTDDVQKIAPNGVMFDTPEQIKGFTDRILNRAVVTKTMPQGNKTEMTQDERDLIQCWIENGAKVK